MTLSIVVAMSSNNVIGNKGKLPWHLPEELRYFKSITVGKPIIMGRKTFESIGRPLPMRKNIILTHNLEFKADGCIVAHCLTEVFELTREEPEAMVIGGAQIYKVFWPFISRIYLTIVHKEYEGDTYFPKIDWSSWDKVSEENRGDFSIIVANKKNKG